MTERDPDYSPSVEVPCGWDSAALPVPNLGEPELVVTASVEEAAHDAAERIAASLIAAVEQRGRADFCTTGGNTPVPIYRLLAQAPMVDRIPWPQVHFWWGDDRFVRRGDPDSCVTSLDEELLGTGSPTGRLPTERLPTGRLPTERLPTGGAPLPSLNIHPIPVDRALAGLHDNEWCAARYAEDLAQVPLVDGNWPGFDLILVGVGDDGHVLSVFPNSPALDSMNWTIGVPAPTHIGPHLPRVTINPRLLEAAPVLVATWGAKKSEALGNVFGPVRDDRRWPVQRARRSGAIWIVDEPAAARIPRELRG
jgi:6-phosphogluconolactonase